MASAAASVADPPAQAAVAAATTSVSGSRQSSSAARRCSAAIRSARRGASLTSSTPTADGRRVEQLVELIIRAGQLTTNRVECGHRLRHLPGCQQALSQEQRDLDSCVRFDCPLQRCREVLCARHRLSGPQFRLTELAQDSGAFFQPGRLCHRTREISGGRFEAALHGRPFGRPPKGADHRRVAAWSGLEQVGRDGLGCRVRAREQLCGLGMPTCPRARWDARGDRGTDQWMDEPQRRV